MTGTNITHFHQARTFRTRVALTLTMLMLLVAAASGQGASRTNRPTTSSPAQPSKNSAPPAAGNTNSAAPTPANSDSGGSNQNVEIIELGPDPGAFANIALTTDLRHVAIVGASGSRSAAFLDGQPGEKYDQISTVPPVLSADGKRMAYAARKGAQWFMVVDGKEYGPYTGFPTFQHGQSSNNQPVEFQMTPHWPIVFSPDSKHVAFIALKGNQSVAVEDGKEITSQGLIDGVTSLFFSKQGDHLVCVLRDTPATASIVLDGVIGPKYGGVARPQFSDDGHHLLYVATKTPGKYTLVVDGKEGPLYDWVGTDNPGANVLISSDGAHIAYVARQSKAQGGNSVVVMDGKEAPNADRVWMSPDGKNFTYLTRQKAVGQERVTIVINGKPGLEYNVFDDLRLAPDGHPIYTVRGGPNSKLFLVDGDKESDAYDSVSLNSIHFSPNGKHMAYVAMINNRFFVVLDGKKFKLFSEIQRPPAPNSQLADERMMRFTADQQHVLYHARDNNNSYLVKDDQILGDDGVVSPDDRRVASVKVSGQGTSSATAQVTLDGQTGPTFGMITKMVFSPDSKHFAYIGSNTVANGNNGGFILMVDGVQKGEYPEVAELQYSPDSQHLFSFSTSHLSGGPGTAYMDQRLFFTSYWLPGYNNEWLDDHRTFQALGRKNDMVFYRVRYFLPGADRSQRNTAASTGTGEVDMQETRRMSGGSGAVSASAAPSSTAAGPTAASASAAASGSGAAASTGTTASATQNAPPRGTIVEVKMNEPVDSNSNPGGKQYHASVTTAVDSGNVVIAQGAAATVTLVRNASAWTVHLSSLVINGQAVAVTSSSASVTSSAQNTVSKAENSVRSVLGGLGRRSNPPPSAAAVASGDRVILPPGVKLHFVLGATP